MGRKRLPDSVYQSVVDAIADCPTQKLAAEMLKMPLYKFKCRLQRAREYGFTSNVKKSERSKQIRTIGDNDKSKIVDARKEIKILKERNELLEKQLYEARNTPDVNLPAVKIPKSKGGHLRIVYSDLHGSAMEDKAVAAALSDLESLAPSVKSVILLGDMMECGGWLSSHHVWGYVKETRYTYEDDVNKTNWFLDRLQEIVPKARIEWMEGNHEHRLEQWAVTAADRKDTDADFLLRMVSPVHVCNLKARGIPYYYQSEYYDDMPEPGIIKRGSMHFCHGYSTAKHAAAKMVEEFGANVRFGHTHRRDYYPATTLGAGNIGAWNAGCLCQRRRMWQHTAVSKWTHGYGLDLVQPDGKFLAVNVPIIDGVSYLRPLRDMFTSF